MKNYILLLILTFGLFTSAFAQVVHLEDGRVEHENDFRPCITLSVAPSPKKVKKEWTNFLDDRYGVELDGYGTFSSEDLLHAEGVVFEAVSFNKMDFYTNVVAGDKGTEIKVFARFGYNSYIGNKNKEYGVIKDIVVEFLSDFLHEYYKDKIETAEKEVKKLMKRKKRISSSIESNSDRIIKLNNEIEKLMEIETTTNSEIGNAEEILGSQQNEFSKLKKQLGIM